MLADALAQAWPPFVLVLGLLLVGEAAAAEGLFEAAGALAARTTLRPAILLAASLALVAAVAALLNLDTAVVFLTPVLVHTARRRGLDERPFVYGALAMSNSASTLLPGSNLTNMLVVGSGGGAASRMAEAMFPAWIAGCALTVAVVGLAFPPRALGPPEPTAPAARVGTGAAACLIAAALMVALPRPAVPVLILGLAVAGRRGRLAAAAGGWLPGLFVLTVALGTLARAWDAPARAAAHLDTWATAEAGAAAALALNNLPAAMLLSARPPDHPLALLLGLDLGPNLAVTGSLSAVLWIRAARAAGAEPSLWTMTRLGAALVPVTLAGSLVALRA